MICEMCGKEVPLTRPVFIEGTKLNVCQNCSKFGDENRGSSRNQGAAPSAQVIEQRLEKRNKRMQTRDVYAGKDSIQIIDGYGDAIKEARIAAGMDLEQLAASIFEKKGTLAKVESESLLPDDKLLKKIEKALNITLTEVVHGGGSIGKGGSNTKMTLANFIKKE